MAKIHANIVTNDNDSRLPSAHYLHTGQIPKPYEYNTHLKSLKKQTFIL